VTEDLLNTLEPEMYSFYSFLRLITIEVTDIMSKPSKVISVELFSLVRKKVVGTNVLAHFAPGLVTKNYVFYHI